MAEGIVVNVEDGPVPLEKLKSRGCKWPVETRGGQHLFCGKPNDGESVYCKTHHGKAHAPSPQKRKRTDR